MMNRDALKRLISPRTICLIGTAAKTDAVAAGSRKIGFTGELWRVDPKLASDAESHYYRSIDELPASPDATFLAMPNQEAPAVAAALTRRGAGGFVCFTGGFSETTAGAGQRFLADLIRSAGDMPFLGPGCYGMLNFFDRVALWPDQVVGESVERGVALICQSHTIARSLMFNDRSVPIGYVFTVGDQARLAVEDLIELLCEDIRVSAFGLYLSDIKDADRFARAAEKARAAGKPIAIIKSGRTEAAKRTTQSNIGALASTDAIFDAFFRQTGIARCDTLATLCETLKLFHCGGPLTGNRVLMMIVSGGMAMTADVAGHLALEFPTIDASTAMALSQILPDRASITNPLEIHAGLRFEPSTLQSIFAVSLKAGFDAVAFMLDNPLKSETDSSALVAALDAFSAVARGASSRAALVSALPEALSSSIRQRCIAAGVAPLQGQRETLEAIALAAATGSAWRGGAAVRLELSAPAGDTENIYSLNQDEGRAALSEYGIATTKRRVATAADAAQRPAGIANAASIESVISDGVAEVLAGLLVDPQFGQILVLAAGGVLTEIMNDSVCLLPPWDARTIEAALARLSVSRLLGGFRGKPAGDRAALIEAILAITQFAAAHRNTLVEIEVNPIIVRPAGLGAIAVDAMIRLKTGS